MRGGIDAGVGIVALVPSDFSREWTGVPPNHSKQGRGSRYPAAAAADWGARMMMTDNTLFRFNGGSGYLLKPAPLRTDPASTSAAGAGGPSSLDGNSAAASRIR